MNKKGQSSSEAPLYTPHLLADPADSLELQDLAGNQPLHLVQPPTLPTPPVSPTTPTDQLLPYIDLPIHPRIMPSLSACPTEVWTRIFSFLDPDSSLKIFPLVSRKALAVSASPSAKALFFLTQYGRGLALYYAYRKHRKALDPLVGKVMLQNGALLPRFVAQKVTSDYHLQLQNGISTALFVFFVNNAYDMYGDLAMFKDNDHTLFERLVRAPLSDAAVSKERVRSLIREYHFTPVDGLCSKPLAENIYFLARLDLSLVSDLVKHGFDLKSVSDSVIERVMLHPYLNVRYLKRYLDVGFVLSDLCIKRALASGRAHTISVLHGLVDEPILHRLACDTIHDLFGPYLDRNTSLNVPWSSDTVQRLIHTFSIPDSVIAKALMSNPESTCTFDTVHPEFPVTRSYLKSRPYPVWQWILTTYGPHHRFSVAAMDDALSRAVADQELHELHDQFLDAGFVLRPRHVKILACRVLHRNMTGNALHVFRVLREQLLDRQLKTAMDPDCRVTINGNSNEAPMFVTDDINCVGEKEMIAFRRALSDEIVDNAEWSTRMHTLQLEGGPRGGAIRIDRPPEDGLRFLEEARRLLGELRLPPPTPVISPTGASRRRNTMPRRRSSAEGTAAAAAAAVAAVAAAGLSGDSSSEDQSDSRQSQASWIQRMQAWWRARSLNNTTAGTPALPHPSLASTSRSNAEQLRAIAGGSSTNLLASIAGPSTLQTDSSSI